MAANATKATLEERVAMLERMLTQLVAGLDVDVIGQVVTDTRGIRWDPNFDQEYPADEPGPPGAWIVEWSDGTTTYW